MPAASVSVARRSRASFHEGANPESAVQARLSRSDAGTAAAVATPLKKVVLADRRRAAAATVSTGGLLGNHFDQLSDESKAAQLQTSHIATTSCDTQIVFPLPREIGEELGVEELEGNLVQLPGCTTAGLSCTTAGHDLSYTSDQNLHLDVTPTTLQVKTKNLERPRPLPLGGGGGSLVGGVI